ncbi:MAG: hypothetical protein ABJB33_01175 [Gemmatimonadota bacterium]
MSHLRPMGGLRWLLVGSLAVAGGCGGSDVLSSGSTYSSVSTGDFNSCAITDTGAALCWGNGSGGRLGGALTNPGMPQPIFAGPLHLDTVVAGFAMGCALAEGEVTLCWGEGVPTPIRTGKSAKFTTLAVDAAACGLTLDGAVGCWDTPGDMAIIIALPAAATAIAVSRDHGCALVADAIWCWPTPHDTATQAIASAGLGLRALTIGWGHGCVLATDNVARCWGSNGSGELGDGTNSGSATLRVVVDGGRLPGDTFTSLHAYANRTCGVTMLQGGFCWGAGLNTPQILSTIRLWNSLSPGSTHACGFAKFDARLWCFGENGQGQLGSGGVDTSLHLVRVVGP